MSSSSPISPARGRWRRARQTIVVFCVAALLGLVGVHLWVAHVTAAGPPRTLWRAALLGLDIGVDAWPAAPEQGGYIEMWYAPHDAEDNVPLLRLPGAPAPTPLPELRPGEKEV
jgi:hypothetical protein